jgi:hypothetical protein
VVTPGEEKRQGLKRGRFFSAKMDIGDDPKRVKVALDGNRTLPA